MEFQKDAQMPKVGFAHGHPIIENFDWMNMDPSILLLATSFYISTRASAARPVRGETTLRRGPVAPSPQAWFEHIRDTIPTSHHATLPIQQRATRTGPGRRGHRRHCRPPGPAGLSLSAASP